MPGTLVTGASGLVGFRLMQQFSQERDVWGGYHLRKPAVGSGQWVQMDLRDRAATFRLLDELRPETIIHSAAYSDPVYCEQLAQEAHALNFGGTLSLSEWASRNGRFLLYVSTDLVFDGRRGDYREEDDPHPISVYGWSKLAGEVAVRSSKAPFAIIRPALIYGQSPGGNRGADERLVTAWNEGRKTPLFVDEYRTPTNVGELVRVIAEVVERRLTGIWHVAAAECVSRFDLGAKVASVLGYSEDLLIPVTIDQVKSIPPRVRNSALNTAKIRSLLDLPFGTIETNLRREYGR